MDSDRPGFKFWLQYLLVKGKLILTFFITTYLIFKRRKEELPHRVVVRQDEIMNTSIQVK